MQMKKRTVLITGGTSGIGRALATSLLDRGNVVIVTGRDQRKIDEVQEMLPALHTLRCEVGDAQDVVALHAAVQDRFPKLDILVNNAGIMRNINLVGTEAVEDVAREIDINLSAPIRIINTFLPLLRRQKNAGIINVSSGLAFIPMAGAPIYSAAKAGLHAYTQSLRAQLAKSGIEVIEIAPPPIETKLFREEFERETKGAKPMSAETLVRKALKAIEAGKTEITPGPARALKIAGRVAPNIMFRQIARMSEF